MKLYSWNVNGIRSVAQKGLLAWMRVAQPDVLCAQETKAHIEQLDAELVRPLGYHAYWHSGVRRGYSGVATFTREEPQSVTVGLGIPEFDDEGRVLMTEFPSFRLFNIYFPNSQRGLDRLDYKLRFCNALLAHLNHLRRDGKPLVICGDYNTAHRPIDLRNPRENEGNAGFLPEERAWIDTFVADGYVDTFRTFHPDAEGCYTWWSYQFSARARNIGWRIDYHFVTSDLMSSVTGARIWPEVTGSDHCPVELELDGSAASR